MSKSIFSGIKIKGIAAAVPENKVNCLTDNKCCSEIDRKKIVALTGVFEYRKSPLEMCSSDLCQKAAESLLQGLNVSPETIDAIIFTTMTPDYRIPSTACILQDKLGCSTSTIAFDINMGCSGYVVGLYNSCALIQGANIKRVLLLSGDTQTKLCYDQDKNVVFLLGDGGTATLLEVAERAEDIAIELMTDGSRFKSLYVPAGAFRKPTTELTREIKEYPDGGKRSEEHISMDGMGVFEFSSTDVIKTIQKFMESRKLIAEDIEYLVLHQANKFMNDKIARKLKFPKEKVPFSIGLYGNTGSASIPLTIVHNYEEMKDKEMNRCLLSGFGVGLSWGVADVVLDNIYCPPVIDCT